MSNPNLTPQITARIVFLYTTIKREINTAIAALIPFTHFSQITMDPRIKGASAAAGFTIKKAINLFREFKSTLQNIVDPTTYQKDFYQLGEQICASLGFAYTQTAKTPNVALFTNRCNDALDQLVRFYANIQGIPVQGV